MCDSGYYLHIKTLIYLKTDIKSCDSNPCANGQCTLNIFSNYKCHCHLGYVGKNCDSVGKLIHDLLVD